jgi:adenylosuccinate lyase
MVQRNAMKAWRGEGDFLTLLKGDPEVGKYLNESELAANFDLNFHFAHVDTIFQRVFG